MATITTGKEVIVTNESNPHFGRRGLTHVRHRDKKTGEVSFGILFYKDGDEKVLSPVPEWVPLRALRAYWDLSFSERDLLRVRREEVLAERKAQMDQLLLEERRKYIDRYVAERRGAPMKLTMFTREYDERVDYYWAIEENRSGYVELTASPTAGMYGSKLPRVEINWSAIGAVSPENAEAVALALRDAVNLAKELRATFEAAQPDLRAALEA